MKSNILNTGLKTRSEQLSTNNTVESADQIQRQDTRLPVDRVRRRRNRRLNTNGVLSILVGVMPEVYQVAEVVGRWVWVQFSQAPAAEIRQKLSQIGFHWNRQRQSWQHPCGRFSLASSQDPREWYGSYFPARKRLA